jgi:predicted permease
MRIPLLAGRAFEPGDGDGPPVMVVSEALARRYFAGRSAVGQRMKFGDPTSTEPWITIVGVVGDVRDDGLASEPRGTMYFPTTQGDARSLWLAVRGAVPAAQLVPQLRRTMASLDPSVPLADVQTLDEWLARSVAQPRFSALMLGIFAAVALLLAAAGIYGVIAYAVAQRRQEIGVRIALGAPRGSVLGMVVRQVMALTLVGLLVGGAGALAGGKVIAGLLYGVRASDPVTFAGVILLLATVALAAAALPAARAARTDPVTAMRGD